MAIQNAILSFSVLDADGDKASIPVYVHYDDATATLAAIQAFMAARASQLDAVLAGQITSMGITIFPALPGGLKGAPVAGSDVERTALLTWDTASSPVRAYGMDLPAAKDAVFTGDLVNVAQADMAAFITGMSPPPGTLVPTDERLAFSLVRVRSGRKSFRKLGRRP